MNHNILEKKVFSIISVMLLMLSIMLVTIMPVAAASVEIDIKPGSYPNSINPTSNGVIPVAILTTTDFDASTVDPQTVELEGAGTRGKGKSGVYGSMEDVDGDGDLDLVVQIVNEIDWTVNNLEATLTGMTWDGIPIQGTDSINVVLPELTVIVNSESGFPPPKSSNPETLQDMTVNIYSLDGILLATKLTDNNGMAVFSLPYDEYTIETIRHATSAWMPTTISFVFTPSNLVANIYMPIVIFRGRVHPLQFNYIDLDSTTPEYETNLSCDPGQTVSVEISWWELEVPYNPVWYVSLFGEWQPTTSLSNLACGVASPSSHQLYTIDATFSAPTEPGIYNVRVLAVLDYDWPCSFYTYFHWNGAWDQCSSILAAFPGDYINVGLATLQVG